MTEKKYSVRMIIRRYVFGLMNAHPNEEVKIPSYNVLAKKFNMARSTAQLELKALLDEGYLISRRGIGTFANIHREKGAAPYVPSVIIVTGSGDYVYKQFSGICFQRNLEETIATFPAKIQELFFSSGNDEQIYEELTSLNSSLLVWLNPDEKRYALIKKITQELPVLTVMGRVENVPCFNYDFTRLGYEIGKELVRQKRFRFMYLECANSNRQIWSGIANAYQEAGVTLDDRYLLEYKEGYVNAEALLKSGFRPDAVFFREGDGNYIVDALRRYNIDLEQDCRLVSPNYKPRTLAEPLLLIDPPFAISGKQAGELAIKIIEKQDIPMNTVFSPSGSKISII